MPGAGRREKDNTQGKLELVHEVILQAFGKNYKVSLFPSKQPSCSDILPWNNKVGLLRKFFGSKGKNNSNFPDLA